MAKESIMSKVKHFISRITFKMYLWASGLTVDEYWELREAQALLKIHEYK